MADWGADVVKIEPPEGDPFRGLFASALGSPIEVNPPFELDNRGKRSVALNLASVKGKEIARKLVDQADVLISNMRPRVLEQFALDYETVRQSNPRIVYCQVTGYGPDHEEANRAAYDVGAFWSRAGIAATLVPAGTDLPQQRGGMGDHMTGANAAGAISAALYAREKSGEGQRLSVSLLRVGCYMMGWDLSLALRLGVPIEPYDRHHAVNPIINCFKAADDKWFWLLLLQADRHWPDLLRAIDREDFNSNERFAGINERRENAPALIEELDQTFAQKTRDEWAAAFDANDVWWAPVNSINDVLGDPLAEQAGVFVDVPGPDGPVRMVATPAHFYGTPAQPRGVSPELGQNTEEVLLEMDYDWEAIIALKEERAII
ncbi:MAG TPA: CoA transferase [Dehalococcoidia bacterium]|nr:CoA transferase [Dehalococcoidia bacterium]